MQIRPYVKYTSLSISWIQCAYSLSDPFPGWYVQGQCSGECLLLHLKEVCNRFQLSEGGCLAITADNVSSKYSMTREQEIEDPHPGIWVAWIQKPYTMYTSRDWASLRFIHGQSGCKMLNQVLGSPWVWSAMGRERKHTQWKVSKNSKRGQL
jgi:hypothetical protein